MIWALVPVKLGETAKARLAPALAPPLRHRLARAMFTDVLTALGAASSIHATVVISRDRDALTLAAEAGAIALFESSQGGLNAAVAEGIAHCASAGATAVVVAMGDLPLLDPRDIDMVVAKLPESGVVLVPSLDGTGTNLLAVRPPGALETHFGPGSLALHRHQVAQRRLKAVVCERPRAALDVDTLADLARLIASDSSRSVTQQLLAAHHAELVHATASLRATTTS